MSRLLHFAFEAPTVIAPIVVVPVPVLVAALRPGDPSYVDHVEIALSRLPEQFKRKQIP